MAITASQTIDHRDGAIFDFPLAASTTILQGSLVALDGSNNLVSATDAASRRCVGVALEEVNNSAGSAGDLRCKVEMRCVKLKNSSGNAITDAHIDRACYVEDNEIVASAAGTNAVVAGIVAKVDTDGVWVFVGVGRGCIAPVTVSTIAAADATNEASAVTLANELKTDFNALHAALKLHGLVK
jgi:hypothetical protein